MKRIAILFLLFSAALPAIQVYRVDPTPVMTTTGNPPVGGFPALYAVAGAQVTLCSDFACTVAATSYSDATGNTACPTTAQVTQPGVYPATCTPYAGNQGQFGFWVPAGTYYFQVVSRSTTYGPYPVTAGGGSGGSGTTTTIPFLTTSDYKFAPMYCNVLGLCSSSPTSGYSLAAGINVLTLLIVPAGVAGTHTVAGNLPHLLYVSGGTGTDEACPIAGGTGTPLQVNGQIIITCAYAHSGAFTIRSNSDGVQECIYVAGPIGACRMPSGTINLWANTSTIAAVEIPGDYSTTLRGVSMRSTMLAPHFTTGDVLVYDFYSVVLPGGLYIHSGNVDTGDYQIINAVSAIHTSGTGLRVRYRADGIVSRVLTSTMFDSIVSEGNGRVTFEDLMVYNFHFGISITCYGVPATGGPNDLTCTSQGNLVRAHVITEVANGRGIYIQDQTTGVTITDPFMEGGNNPVGAGTTALFLQVPAVGYLNEIVVHGGFLDSHSTCMYINGNGTDYRNNSVQLVAVHVACSNYGVLMSGYVQNVLLSGNWIQASGAGVPGNAAGIRIDAHVRGLKIYSNNINTDGTACWYFTGAASNVDVVGNSCGTEIQPLHGIAFESAVSNANVSANTLSSSVSAVDSGIIPTHLNMASNPGIDDVIGTLADASTISLDGIYNPSIKLTGGTTAVTTILGAYATGLVKTFINTTSGSVVIGGGGNVPLAHTVDQNASLTLRFDGTNWY